MITWQEMRKGARNIGSAAQWGWEHSIPHAIGDTVRNAASSNSYSDFVSKSNESTNGWYSTVAAATPLVRGVHNALLGRDSALDYLSNTGLSWSDIPGYNAARLTGGASSGLSTIGGDGHRILEGVHDLAAFYRGDPVKKSDSMYGVM